MRCAELYCRRRLAAINFSVIPARTGMTSSLLLTKKRRRNRRGGRVGYENPPACGCFCITLFPARLNAMKNVNGDSGVVVKKAAENGLQAKQVFRAFFCRLLQLCRHRVVYQFPPLCFFPAKNNPCGDGVAKRGGGKPCADASAQRRQPGRARMSKKAAKPHNRQRHRSPSSASRKSAETCRRANRMPVFPAAMALFLARLRGQFDIGKKM